MRSGYSGDTAVKPNIVVIIADDLGYSDVGCYGCQDIPTPNIDRVAKQGVRCTSGYVTHPFCSPSRAGLLTGRYQQRFGHENNPTFLPNDEQVGLRGEPRLFNLASDIAEQCDLASADATLLNELESPKREWDSQLVMGW